MRDVVGAEDPRLSDTLDRDAEGRRRNCMSVRNCGTDSPSARRLRI